MTQKPVDHVHIGPRAHAQFLRYVDGVEMRLADLVPHGALFVSNDPTIRCDQFVPLAELSPAELEFAEKKHVLRKAGNTHEFVVNVMAV